MASPPPSVQTIDHQMKKGDEDNTVTVQELRVTDPSPNPPKRGGSFWLIFFALAVSMYEAAFELCAVGMALPSIAEDLNAVDFVWVGSAYALASCCALPMTGGLAQAFGRRDVMIGSLIVFAVGATICGAAPNMNALIAGRVVQGLGGGGILSLPTIILSDLVPLKQRGAYNGLLGVCWSTAIATGAVIGGALSGSGKWRWIFYMNLPITALALGLVVGFLKVARPKGSFSAKLKKLDWTGNFIIVASTCACCIALTWAGIKFPWSSARILVPLCGGLAGMVLFVIWEVKFASTPLIPFHLLSHRTTVIGYFNTFLNALIAINCIYYFPVYLQACKGFSPMRAGGLGWLGISLTVGPFGIVAGLSVVILKRYRPIIAFGWATTLVGLGLWTTLHVDSSTGTIVGYQLVWGVGVGALYTTLYFPVLAPVPVEANARALAFFNFLRSFGQVWGVTIGASVLQNQLLHKLPTEFVQSLPSGVQLAYTAIRSLENQKEPLRSMVREAFAESERLVWITVLGIAATGAATMLFMQEVKMHEYTDSDWGIEEEREGRSDRAAA
ncbi:MFS general substrate transporter [Exidia glandulosa HHB12029]|uniref:MFS general substrate transporter n=1 Tax=Exidia glandulosa HHB12029 TaxID=1314781 RepID=A0A165EJ98_EXIGL|nr:MFS general substrate transporter [Exidia glandulosa HHB12029]